MTAARLRLDSMLVVVARWSTDLNVIFISAVRCTAMKMNRLEVFRKKKRERKFLKNTVAVFFVPDATKDIFL